MSIGKKLLLMPCNDSRHECSSSALKLTFGVRFDLEEELKKGRKVYDIPSLFSVKTHMAYVFDGQRTIPSSEVLFRIAKRQGVEKSLELNPDNVNGKDMLKKLGVKKLSTSLHNFHYFCAVNLMIFRKSNLKEPFPDRFCLYFITVMLYDFF